MGTVSGLLVSVQSKQRQRRRKSQWGDKGTEQGYHWALSLCGSFWLSFWCSSCPSSPGNLLSARSHCYSRNSPVPRNNFISLWHLITIISVRRVEWLSHVLQRSECIIWNMTSIWNETNRWPLWEINELVPKWPKGPHIVKFSCFWY